MQKTEAATVPSAFPFREVESNVSKHWTENAIVNKAKEKVKNGKRHYFLDGPPYTSGKVHIGTAWNKSLKDCYLRYCRMRGFNVWDRAGYDMHGLPTEKATEKALQISGKEQIEAFGREKFVQECYKYCVANMHEMNSTFKKLGVWMDFDGAYQSVTPDFIEGEWWFIKKAHQKGRLYEGDKTMTWDPINATALAKHELEYKSITDDAIYVRFRLSEQKDTYFVIWTTTPWTIPFNLAVMVNPTVLYAKVQLTFKGEVQYWIIASDLVDDLVHQKLGLCDFVIVDTCHGNKLAGLSYDHPFGSLPIYAQLKEAMPKVHTCLLSDQYVNTSSGTGIVHCAPGCGPEDYEVGHANGIQPFNTVDDAGIFRNLGDFTGLRAKLDDKQFILAIDKANALVYSHKYTHDYPHGERTKQPVIFRTTSQWFLKVEDIKQKLVEENKKIKWVPEAAFNAFNVWLENLRDNSISKQRYWGTPLPIWKNVDDPTDYLVIGSVKELVQFAGLTEAPLDLHISTVDKITFSHFSEKDHKVHVYRRVPDVLDVWVDAGSTSWNCLNWPAQSSTPLEEWCPAEFILEGRDQIRGWFNLLHVMSMIAFDRPAFKACYMHGFVNDSEGRKMSKSLQNYILPEEVTGKYGVDTMRFYMIGAANPGLDMNYNFKDIGSKSKTIGIIWNLHKYVISLTTSNPGLQFDEAAPYGQEELYILSRLHSTVARVTESMDKFYINEGPALLETFFLELSHVYIQLVGERVSSGSDAEKVVTVNTLLDVFSVGLTMLAIVSPFVVEQMHQNLKKAFPESSLFKSESVHLNEWPTVSTNYINHKLENDVQLALQAITAILAARDAAGLAVKWPALKVCIECTASQQETLGQMQKMILTRTNIKQLTFEHIDTVLHVAPNSKAIGKSFGKNINKIMSYITAHPQDIGKAIEERSEVTLQVDDEKFVLTKDHISLQYKAADPSFVRSKAGNITVFLDVTRTQQLEYEGMAREIARRVQILRKNLNLVKLDKIHLYVQTSHDALKTAITQHMSYVSERNGAAQVTFVEALGKDMEASNTENIKGMQCMLGIKKL